ncbi:hypothetical protein F0562_013426 [Nyssa sinensis]|uniref:PH domain-containing protein n=1 Tax=Nyssa sinensis TaxID=561372 RepID=A0A5J4ZKF3_9ASTE|nr:hypothetical protein F0562_013426 [Nyssa sinensis]
MCCASFVRQAITASLSFDKHSLRLFRSRSHRSASLSFPISFVPDLTDLFRSRSHRSDENDASLSFAPTHNTRTSSEEYSSQRRRRSRSNDSFLEAIKEVGLTMGREIKESTIKLTEAMAYDVTVAAKRVRINEELLKLPTISMFERHKATLQIARDHETTYVFFTIADDEKEEWVKALLRGDI